MAIRMKTQTSGDEQWRRQRRLNLMSEELSYQVRPAFGRPRQVVG